MYRKNKIAVVIPCYNVSSHIEKVVKQIPEYVDHVLLIDDASKDKTSLITKNIADKIDRVEQISHKRNKGVGGAVKTGYQKARHNSSDIVVKVDGDGQMDTTVMHQFLDPIIDGNADYTKGNRFYSIYDLKNMPTIRLLGNSVLSLVNKFINGYWQINDPTNGYTAIQSTVLQHLPLDKIDDRYFFESDMLFRLSTFRAVVTDIPINVKYEDEVSNLNIGKVILKFPLKYLKRFFKRLFYNYFLREFNVGTINLIVAVLFLGFGLTFGISKWFQAAAQNNYASSGTVMLAALPIIIGFQALLAFLQFDVQNQPKSVIHKFE